VIGVLIFTHGDLCHGVREAAGRLSGGREQVACLSMRTGEMLATLMQRLSEALKDLDLGDGVVVFCDVTGGTPWNICGQLRRKEGVALQRIGGLSLPAVIKALQDRGEHSDLGAWAAELTEYAASHVTCG
jgi:PTS system mannose-specific IIA component